MDQQALIVAVRRQLGHVVVTVIGEIDIATAAQLRNRLAGPVGDGQQVIVDLSGVGFIDAAGLGVLARAAAQAAVRGGGLQLAAARRSVRRVLAVTGLDGSIPLAASVAEAEAALCADPDTWANGGA